MSKREVNLAGKPALIPLFGGLEKKPRLIDRDVITVGRARGCDVILEAPDVSTLHCILYRSPEGFRLRDCGSRTGTRLNGAPIRNQLLADEDVLHVGPFSFQVHLPDQHGARIARKSDREHLDRSRRHFAQLAIQLRRRCRDLLGGQAGIDRPDLRRHESDLKSRIRAYDQRANQLEEAERELEDERSELHKEKEAHQVHLQKTEHEIAHRLKEVDAQVHERWQEFQSRCCVEEQRLKQWSERLQEADHETINPEHEEIMQMRERVASEQAEMNNVFERQRLVLSEAEAALKEQRQELGRMMGDLREMQQAVRQERQADVPALVQENQRLKQCALDWQQKASALEARASLLEEQPAQASHDPAFLKELRAQADLLDALKAQVAHLETFRDESARLQKENEQAKKWLAEKDRMISDRDKQLAESHKKLDRTGTPSHASIDLETYETELNQYRQQLETDRARLNAEMDSLRIRNTELDEATREMEMGLSRERAELARERIRLDRLREEVRSEMERMQRDAGVRESLAPLQKLREELNQKKGVATAPDNRLNDRLRNLRNQLQE